MSASSPQGRNSEGVTTVRFERTDASQQFWFPVPIYSAEHFHAIDQLVQCFRNVRDRELGLAAVLFRRTDFPQMGWITYVADNQYETARSVPSISQLVNSFRNVRDRSLYQDGERKIIQGTNNGEPPAPAEFGWDTAEEHIRVFAQRADLSVHQQTQPDPSWMAFAANIFYDQLTMSGWIEPLGGFRPPSGIRYQRDTNRDISWASSVQQLVGWAAIHQLANSFRNVRDRSLYLDGQKRAVQGSSSSGSPTQEFDPQIDPWTIPSHRVPGKPYWSSPGPSVDWLFAPVQQQGFDPATHPWTIASHYPRKTRPEQLSWTKSGYFISLFYNPAQAGWTTESQLVRHAPWWTGSDPNVDWIPPVVRIPFDTTQRHNVIDSQRVPGKPYWTCLWQGNDWITPELLAELAHDPALQDWTMQTTTYRSRAWWSDSPQPDAWLVPSAQFDPTLWPSTAIPSHRELPKAVGRWQPDLDNAWMGENPVVPNFFNASFAPGANTLDQPGGSPERSS